MAKVIDCVGEDVALLELKRDPDVVWEQNDFGIVVDMLFGCLAEDHDLAQVNKHEFPFDS